MSCLYKCFVLEVQLTSMGFNAIILIAQCLEKSPQTGTNFTQSVSHFELTCKIKRLQCRANPSHLSVAVSPTFRF